MVKVKHAESRFTGASMEMGKTAVREPIEGDGEGVRGDN